MSSINPSATPGRKSQVHWLRFSTGGLLALATAASLTLAAYFSVGRLLGMSNADIASMALYRLIYLIPMLAVWTFALSLTLARKRREGRSQTWAVVVYSLFMATAIGVDLHHMVIIFELQKGVWLADGGFSFVTVASVVLNVAWWILILVVISNEGHRYAQSLACETLPDDEAVKSGCSS